MPAKHSTKISKLPIDPQVLQDYGLANWLIVPAISLAKPADPLRLATKRKIVAVTDLNRLKEIFAEAVPAQQRPNVRRFSITPAMPA